MKQDRAGRTAFAVRTPNLITINLAQQRERSYVLQRYGIVHQMIAEDLERDPQMMVSDVPPDPDDWLARWLRVQPMVEQPAPPTDDLHAGETVAVQPVQPPTGRSFWSYAETAAR